MPTKRSVLNIIFVALSVITSSIIALSIISHDDLKVYYYEIWRFWTIKDYFLISLSTFSVVNVFGAIDKWLNRSGKSTIRSNLNALYGYIAGSLIYFIIGLTVYDSIIRIYCLTIPILLIAIGFNIPTTKTDLLVNTKKLLLTTNIILGLFWLAMMFNLYVNFESIKEQFENEQTNFHAMDERYLKHGDSLRRVFDNTNRFELLRQLDNDTIESIVLEQMILHQEFSEYRRHIDFRKEGQLNFLNHYSDMRNTLIAGMITMLLLNGLYIMYFLNEQRRVVVTKI